MTEERSHPPVSNQNGERQPDPAADQTADELSEAGEQGILESVQDEAQLRERLAATEAQANEYKDQWLRSVAEFKNFKRRAEAERSEVIRSASAGLVLKLLPILDDFERAIVNIPADVAATSWWEGTQLIAQKLRTVLESEGVTPIEALGETFDPNLHDAVLYEEAEGQDGKVIAELQKGYKLRDRILRPTMVKVGKGD